MVNSHDSSMNDFKHAQTIMELIATHHARVLVQTEVRLLKELFDSSVSRPNKQDGKFTISTELYDECKYVLSRYGE